MGKRVVIVVSHIGSGGAQRAAYRLARELRKRGHDANVWGLYRKQDPEEDIEQVSALLDDESPGGFGYMRLAWRCFRELRKTRPDTVVSFLPLANVVGQTAALLSGVKHRIVSHRVLTRTYSSPMRWLDWLSANTGVYTHAVAVSDAVRQSVPAWPGGYRQNMQVIYNGIDWRPSGLSAEQARDVFGLPQKARLLLAVGRMAPQKNYPFLLRAAAGLPDLHLVIAGDGELRPDIEALATELDMVSRLHILGHLPPSRLPDLYRACNAFALSSLFEGQSNALLEAMYEGMLIFASDIPEQVETLVGSDGEKAGILLPTDNPQAWIDAFQSTLDDQSKKAHYQQAARQRAEAFSLERMTDAYEAIIDPALAG